MRALAPLTVVLGTAMLAGCDGYPFGDCTLPVIETSGPVVWTFEGETAASEVFDQLAESNLTPGTFEPIAQAFAAAGDMEGSLTWLTPTFDTIPGYVGVRMELPVHAGDRIPIRGVTPIGGYHADRAPFDRALVQVRLGDFVSTEASGSIEILGTDPLRLRLELTADDGTGRTLTTQMELGFRVYDRETECS